MKKYFYLIILVLTFFWFSFANNIENILTEVNIEKQKTESILQDNWNNFRNENWNIKNYIRDLNNKEIAIIELEKIQIKEQLETLLKSTNKDYEAINKLKLYWYEIFEPYIKEDMKEEYNIFIENFKKLLENNKKFTLQFILFLEQKEILIQNERNKQIDELLEKIDTKIKSEKNKTEKQIRSSIMIKMKKLKNEIKNKNINDKQKEILTELINKIEDKLWN